MWLASRVSDCLPVPPTPTNSALPRPWRIMRAMREICSIASKKNTIFTSLLYWRLKSSWYFFVSFKSKIVWKLKFISSLRVWTHVLKDALQLVVITYFLIQAVGFFGAHLYKIAKNNWFFVEKLRLDLLLYLNKNKRILTIVFISKCKPMVF